MLQSVMPVPCPVLVPDVLPAVMPVVPAVPEFLPAAPAAPALLSRVPADLPAAGREELAAALAGPVPGAQRKAGGRQVLPGEGDPLAWDDAEMKRFLGFLRSMPDRRDPRGRRIPLDYLTAVAVAASAAGDDSPEGAAAWAASAPARLLYRLGAPSGASGRPRRPDAATFSRVLGDPRHAQQVDDALCAWAAARARDLRPGMRRHLRVDGKALRGAARGGRAPMLLSGLWDDGTTAAQLPVNTKKTNEIPVFRDLLDKIPPGDLKDAVISADQMHTQRKHAKKIDAAGAYFIFTIGDNQEKLFDAAEALPWRAIAGEAWTVDRGHGRIDARTIKTLPPTAQILEKWPQVRQVFLVERYSYSTTGNCSARSPCSASRAFPRVRPTPLTCSPTCADTGPSRCTIMSAMSRPGRTGTVPPPRTRPSPPSATPSPAPSACSRSRVSPPSSAPAAATPTACPSSSSASQSSPRHPPDTTPKPRRDQSSPAARSRNNRNAATSGNIDSPSADYARRGLCRRHGRACPAFHGITVMRMQRSTTSSRSNPVV